MKICSKEYFSNYIFHPRADELSPKEKRKALTYSIGFGVLTLGICHLVCAIKYRNRKYSIQTKEKTPTASKVEKIVPKPNQQKKWTYDELMKLTPEELKANFTEDEFFNIAERLGKYSAQHGLALMTKAAELGNVAAIREVGRYYWFGDKTGDQPVEKDLTKAIEWFTKAANKGDTRACGYLASIYLDDKYGTVDEKEGAKWLLLAFQKGAKNVGIIIGTTSIAFGTEEHAKAYLKSRSSHPT